MNEALLLSRFYAYGNRFDRPLPDGLDPWHIKKVVEAFFISEVLELNDDAASQLIIELIDYGFQLALLDLVEDKAQATSFAGEQAQLILSDWCKIIKYSLKLLRELNDQENNLGELLPEEIASIVFFIHPDMGAASLAIDKNTEQLLQFFKSPDDFDSTNSSLNLNGGSELSRKINAAVDQLRKLHILISRTNSTPTAISGR